MAITEAQRKQILANFGLSVMPLFGEGFEVYRERAQRAGAFQPGAEDDYLMILRRLELASPEQGGTVPVQTPPPASPASPAQTSQTIETKKEVVAAVVATPSATAKVLSGLIAGGKVGTAAAFVPREDDVIDSLDDLERAAQFNLVSFLLSITSRLTYEIKLVNRLVLRDGTVKQAGAVQIITGYTKAGTPKYRTLINKLAVMTIYAISDTGTRSKIAVVNLGPSDAVKLNPSAAQVTNLQAKVQKEVQITEVGNVIEVRGESASTKPTTAPASAPATQPATTKPTTAPASAPATQPATTKPGANATTLFDWYAAQGQTLPTIAFRAQLYEKMKLGSAALYMGTAEQNTKLLNALKAG